MTIHAIFKNGVFVPKEKVDLPESAEFVFDPLPVAPLHPDMPQSMRGVIEALSMRCDSGDPTLAARHDEHF